MLKRGRSKSLSILYLITAILLGLGFIDVARAEENSLFINELMIEGSSVSSADEWVELYNSSQAPIDLSGFSLTDEVKSSKLVSIASGQIEPNSFFLIANNSEDHLFKDGESALNVKPDLIDSGISLSNSLLSIGLRNNNDELIDIAGSGKSTFLSGFKKPIEDRFYSLQRLNYFKSFGDLAESWRLSDESINLDQPVSKNFNFGTPRLPTINKINNFKIKNNSFKLDSQKQIDFSFDSNDLDDRNLKILVSAQAGENSYNQTFKDYENSFILPKSSNCWEINFQVNLEDQLIFEKLELLQCFEPNYNINFSEVLTAPKNFDWNKDGSIDGSDEWFELANNSKLPCNLNGWTVKDKSGKVANLAGFISAGQYKVLFSFDTKLSLNNSSESLYLYDQSGELIDSVQIPALDYDVSYSKINNLWDKTSVPSPEAINVKNEPPKIVKDEQILVSRQEIPEINAEEPFESDETGEITSTVKSMIIPATLASFSQTKTVIIPKVGPIVLGESARSANYPFKLSRNLIYFFSVLVLISILFIYFFSLYEIYRRE